MASVWVARRRAARPAGRGEDPPPRARRSTTGSAAGSARRRSPPPGLAHPNIVATYDTGEDDDVAYIVMELVDGRDPAPAARPTTGPMPVPQTRAHRPRRWRRRSTHAHRNGIVHRDMKPAQRARPGRGPGEGHRLRHRQGDRARATSPAPARSSAPRATSRPSRCRARPTRRPHRRLRARARALRDARRPAAVRRRHRDGHRGRAPHRPPAPIGSSIRPEVPPGSTPRRRASTTRPETRLQAGAAIPSAGRVRRDRSTGALPHAVPPRGRRPRPRRAAYAAPPAAHARPTPSPHPAPGAATPDRGRKPAPAAGSGVLAFIVVPRAARACAAGYLVAPRLDDGNGRRRSPATARPTADGVARSSPATDFDPFGDRRPREPREPSTFATDGNADHRLAHRDVRHPRLRRRQARRRSRASTLDGSTDVSHGRDRRRTSGYNVEIYVADSPPTRSRLGPPRAAGTDLGTHAQLRRSSPRRPAARARVVHSCRPTPVALDVAEVRVG